MSLSNGVSNIVLSFLTSKEYYRYCSKVMAPLPSRSALPLPFLLEASGGREMPVARPVPRSSTTRARVSGQDRGLYGSRSDTFATSALPCCETACVSMLRYKAQCAARVGSGDEVALDSVA